MWKREKCGEWMINSPNKCRCKEFIIIDSEGEEVPMRAYDEEGAALKYAEEYNQDEGDLMGEEIDIMVKTENEVITFTIGAEPDVHYYAKKDDD